MNAPRGGIRFVKPPDLVAAGGLCAPVAAPYELLATNDRPVRSALIDAFAREVQRMALPPDERIAFDLQTRRYAESGRPDIAARVAEARFDYDGGAPDEVFDHEWDQPITFRYLR